MVGVIKKKTNIHDTINDDDDNEYDNDDDPDNVFFLMHGLYIYWSEYRAVGLRNS